MIAIIDLACTNFSHEMFNSGTIYQIHLAFPQDAISYFAEKEQINCVKKILNESYCTNPDKKDSLTNISFIPIEYAMDGSDEPTIVKKIIQENCDITSIVITSFISMEMNALYDVIKLNQHIKFAFLLHGKIEHLIQNREKLHLRLPININYRLFLRQFQIVVRRICQKRISAKKIFSFRKSLCQLVQLSNVHLIVFSNEWQKHQAKIASDICYKINVFYLPYVYDFTIKNRISNNTIKIGIMPSTHYAPDGYARSLAYYVYKHSKPDADYLFEIINGDNSWLCLGKHVHITSRHPLDRCELNKILYDCDWILLPYGKKKYQLSCSGVLFDALNMQTPCLMGPSACFNDFDKYSIGIHTDSYKDLKKQFLQIIETPDHKKLLEYSKNIKSLKQEMNNYNIQAFKNLLQ